MTLFGEPTGETTIAGEKEDERLVLSSVHQAKGLEWRAVFVIGLIEDRFPNVRAARTAAGLEEERRLFYVAATRAKDELFLVHPLAAFDRYGIVVVTEPSRFLRELPEDLFERWVLEPGPAAPDGAGARPRSPAARRGGRPDAGDGRGRARQLTRPRPPLLDLRLLFVSLTSAIALSASTKTSMPASSIATAQ